MRVILLQDVAKLGRKGAIVDVPDGQAQNQLLPRKLAKPATPENLKAAESLAAGREAAEARALEKYRDTKAALAGKAVIITAPKNPGGHLFAAVTKGQVMDAMGKAGVAADPSMVEIPRAIKTDGEHEGLLVHGREKSPFIIKVN